MTEDTSTMDNIVDNSSDNCDNTEYMQTFDQLGDMVEKFEQDIDLLNNCSHDQERVSRLVEWANNMTEYIKLNYNFLVLLHNMNHSAAESEPESVPEADNL